MTTAARGMRETAHSDAGGDLRLFMIAGEHSGDALGAKLMAALNARHRGRIRYLGVGGAQMAQQGLVSQFPIEEVAVMGPAAILARLPRILRRIYGTAAALIFPRVFFVNVDPATGTLLALLSFGIGYIGGGDDGCYVTRPVMTPFGYRLRTINVCGY